MSSPIVDVHTHIYPPSYLSLLRARTTVPYLLDLPAPAAPRLIILPSDDNGALAPSSRGRPIGLEYSFIEQKLLFMSTHNIDVSVISLANPWLDFLPPGEALSAARDINDELEAICKESKGKLYAFATLPVSAPSDEVVAEINRLQQLSHIRGIILGTGGLGSGLDDVALEPIWAMLEKSQLLLFLHPHYGLPTEVFGPRAQDYGHVLPLSLGFPMETTIAFVRMWLSGVFDRYQRLRVLIAHAGGTVPFLAGRVESCVEHERHFRDEKGRQQERRGIWNVLRQNVWLDAVTYSELGVRAAIEAVGVERVLFGTDHPFFPPLDEGTKEWVSVKANVTAIEKALDGNNDAVRAVLGLNILECFLKEEGGKKKQYLESI
ncbi:hypothetical protein MMC29_003906 [Sticta canariensis]|nr:hypothetical protein [Sticta canariensis]